MPDEEACVSLDAHRLRARCPKKDIPYFTSLTHARTIPETFFNPTSTEPAVNGTTRLHPEYALGSINVGDLWNQRRPLLAYWKQGSGVGALRLRCLHDGYDYASASFFSLRRIIAEIS